MNPTVNKKSKLFRILLDGKPIGELNLNGPNGTLLYSFKLRYKLPKNNLFHVGEDYHGFTQEEYLTTILKGLAKALKGKITFSKKYSKLEKARRGHSVVA